jgi:hypothetical protein
MSKLLIGPYIGSYRYEIIVFIPYMHYLLSVLEYDEVVIASHSNRQFIYNSFNLDFYPVFGNITRNELYQKGIICADVNKQQYTQIIRLIKSEVGGITEQQSTPYIKNHNQISNFQRIYKPFPGFHYTKGDDIIFIPNKNKENRILYDELKDKYDITVLGDMNNGLPVYNELLKRPDYFDIVYEYMFDKIHNCKFVITSCPEWVLICNLQQIPVLYWGNDASLYKQEGIYGFNNKNVISIREMNVKMIDYMNQKRGE